MLIKIIRHGYTFWEVAKPAAEPKAELPEAQADKYTPVRTHHNGWQNKDAPKAIVLHDALSAAKTRNRRSPLPLDSAEAPPNRPADITLIQEAIIAEFQLYPGHFFGNNKRPSVSHPRFASMALCRELTDRSLAVIGGAHWREHSEVRWAEQRYEDLRETEPAYKARVDALEMRLRAQLERLAA